MKMKKFLFLMLFLLLNEKINGERKTRSLRTHKISSINQWTIGRNIGFEALHGHIDQAKIREK